MDLLRMRYYRFTRRQGWNREASRLLCGQSDDRISLYGKRAKHVLTGQAFCSCPRAGCEFHGT